MNRITGILCFCLLLSIYSTAQIDQKVNFTHRVMYNYTFQPDSLDESLKISEDMILQVGKDHSNFMAYNQYLTDSMMAEMRRQAAADMAAGLGYTTVAPKRLPQSRVDFKLLKDHKRYFQYLTTNFGVHHAEYVELLQTPAWTLVNDDSTTIAGYKCKKAITTFAGRDYIAWYATGLGLNAGPYKFHGLPGLTMLVYDTKRHHVFTAITVFAERRKITLREDGGMYYHRFHTKEDFLAFSNDMKAHPEKMFEQNLIKIPDEKMKIMGEKMREKMEKNNNPIELK